MKPIIFNTEMVRAILRGDKTMTRRVIKPQPQYTPALQVNGDGVWRDYPRAIPSADAAALKAQHYNIGDVLYVRETWSDSACDQFGGLTLTAVAFKATDVYSGRIWKPSIHMPKEAARLFLKITNVRAERLQEITEHDARDEGFADVSNFKNLWNKVALPADKWENNPWVWVYEFETVSKPKEA